MSTGYSEYPKPMGGRLALDHKEVMNAWQLQVEIRTAILVHEVADKLRAVRDFRDTYFQGEAELLAPSNKVVEDWLRKHIRTGQMYVADHPDEFPPPKDPAKYLLMGFDKDGRVRPETLLSVDLLDGDWFEEKVLPHGAPRDLAAHADRLHRHFGWTVGSAAR